MLARAESGPRINANQMRTRLRRHGFPGRDDEEPGGDALRMKVGAPSRAPVLILDSAHSQSRRLPLREDVSQFTEKNVELFSDMIYVVLAGEVGFDQGILRAEASASELEKEMAGRLMG
jgi:hypothetical protein